MLGQGNFSLTNPMQNWLATSSQAAEDLLLHQVMDLTDTLVGYKELMMIYSCAMRSVRTKFETLDNEFSILHRRNPIHSISTRLKSNTSIMEKMIRKGTEFSLEGIENGIQDIAGVRVICSYVDDIYLLAEALTRQDDIDLLEQKDYISAPKPNGYRSLHMIVSVPVYLAAQKKQVTVEVQIRTIAMDLWASLEHQLKYKQEIKEESEIVQRLKDCADIIAGVDLEMQQLRICLDEASDKPATNDLLAKLKKLEIPIM